jgi:hypothetical protein
MSKLYSITYKKPHNFHRSCPQSFVRGIATAIVRGEDAVRAKIAEIEGAGREVISVYDNTGKKVVIA